MEINENAKAFFKCSNNLNANIMLNSLLETEGIDCSISSAMTTALMHGCFLWINAITPSGLAASAIISEDHLRNDVLHEGMVLELKTQFEMSKSSLEKLTKTQILFPSTIEGLIERLQAITALSEFFFGSNSPASQGLKSSTLKCMDNKSLLRARCIVDEEFISKILCCVDDRLYQWLKECCWAMYAKETTLELTNFGSLFHDIQMNRFHYRLPINVRAAKKIQNKNKGVQQSDRNRRNKQRKQNTTRTKSPIGKSVKTKNGRLFFVTKLWTAQFCQLVVAHA